MRGVEFEDGMVRRLLAAALVTAVWASPAIAHASPTLSGFSVSPSTLQAGGHPDLRVSASFTEPATLQNVSLHLPAGLTANPSAIPLCSRKRLLANLCSPATKVGSITVVGVAYGLDLPVTKKIYNVRTRAGEKLRLGVPIIGSYSQPGIAAELPVTERPADKGLDLAVTGLPSNVGGIPVRIKQVSFWLKGVARKRKHRKTVTRAFLTNPSSCGAATSALEVTLHETPTPLTAAVSFTPSGCAPAATTAVNGPCSRSTAIRATRSSSFGRKIKRRLAGMLKSQTGAPIFGTYDVAKLICRDVTRDNKPEMIVLLQCCTVSTPSPWAIFGRNANGWQPVFDVVDRHLAVYGKGLRVNRAGDVVETLPRYKKSDALCCPSSLYHRTTHWNGSRFVTRRTA